MRNLFICAFAVIYLLTACSGGSNGMNKTEEARFQSSLIDMNTFETDAEKFISFPIWFNDSIIKACHIHKITRDYFSFDPADTLEMKELYLEVPRERREYWFSEKGGLKELKISYFYDDQEIGAAHYVYLSEKDKHGFAKVMIKSDTNVVIDWDEKDMEFPVRTHQLIKESKKYIAYKDDQTGAFLFFMLNKKFWGPLSVDSILKPSHRDLVVLGSSYHPSKKYQVQNKVNERNVTKFVYYKKSKKIASIIREEYPFTIKRSILFDKNGRCTGFIDSTFTDNEFLTRTVSDIKMDKQKLPVKIVRKKLNQLNETGRIVIERIKYE